MNKEIKPPKTSFQLFNTDGGENKSNGIEIPSIALPKGGGAIKGIDEKFSVNAVNGTASFSIPLPFSPGRGASLTLSLNYNSGAGNGIFGLGWKLSLPSIKRKTDKELPKYTDSDTCLFSEADDLVPQLKKEDGGALVLDENGNCMVQENDSSDGFFTIRLYRPRIEGLFARIERWTHKATGEIKWRVITRENITTLFGWSVASRIADPQNENKIFEWLPEFVFDDKGNCSHYVYKKEDGQGLDASLPHNRNRTANGNINYTNLYLEKVLYGNKTPYKKIGAAYPAETDYLFQTVFDYGEYDVNAPYAKIKDWDCRKDEFSQYRAGFEIRTTRLCRRVLLFHYFAELPGGAALVKSLNFSYDPPDEADFALLQSITAYGYIRKPDGTYTHKNLPPLELKYAKFAWNKDINFIAQDDSVHTPPELDEPQQQFADLFNEGLPGMLTKQGEGWFYRHNLGNGRFAAAKPVSPQPSFAGAGSRLQLMDLDADGGKQLVSLGSEPKGYFELNDEEEWQVFRSFKNLPNINWRDSNARMIDLNGDGRAEILITEDNIFTVYESAGREGFSPAYKTAQSFDDEEGPRLLFADTVQTIFLADMSGDGLTDIVRIRNGAVCYWPNLGYGKFGSKVNMDHAPVFDSPDAFNPAYLRLADIDGSGAADVIYLGKNKFNCWKNLSGNRFSAAALEVDGFPEVNNQSKITVTDLLGNGGACIVWSSGLAKDNNAPLKYIDLMNGGKPYLLTAYRNNLGKEVALEYTPSTSFYIADKLAGRPWVTKLHFPVHCISKTEIRDRITGHRFVSSYQYHHGYYDHDEREFRGFGMVEQIDAEDFDHWVKGGAGNIVEKTLHQAPVVTRRWFHTGAFSSKGKMHNMFAHEYWYEEMARQGFTAVNNEAPWSDARLIAASGLNLSSIDHLSAEEWREALRACKGMCLRSEVFASDAPLTEATTEQIQKQLTPYSVDARSYIIELLQPRGMNEHAVLRVQESEAITYNYERDTEDPRITHNLNIKLDEYGNVLESAAVVYPRMQADASLPIQTQQAQNQTAVIYTQNRFTNDAINEDTYLLRLPSEVKTFELNGVPKPGSFYTAGDFADILSDAKSTEAEYHETEKPLSGGKAQRRLIEHVRSTFYKNDLTAALPLHQLDSPALPFESRQLACTPALLHDIFGARVNEDLMLEGKFIIDEDDGNWWISSGARQFIENAETVVNAQNRFYKPVSYTDPCGAKTKVRYYGGYFLFIEETEDAAGNKTSVDLFNFRTLCPQRMKDANANLSEVLVDELGLVNAVAVFGKGSEADDLTGLTEFTAAAEKTQIAGFFNAPDSVQLTGLGKDLLQHATARYVYDFDAYLNSGKPAAVASIAREEHFQTNGDSPVRLSFEYSSGLGQVVMTKVQAGPGKAKQVFVNENNTYSVADFDTAALDPAQLRWTGSGRTVLNNKGNKVKQYEPYFSVTHQYEDWKELVETGVSPLMYYDAPGRLIKTELPDGTFSQTEFNSWQQIFYDPNDTVGESSWYSRRIHRLMDDELIAEGKDPVQEKTAAEKAAAHADTPNIQCLDTLGRPVLSVEHNKDLNTGVDEFYYIRMQLDIEGNLLSATDARGNTVMQCKYDMLGNKLYQNSGDAGQRWMLSNVLGSPLRTWDERNHEFRYFYDDPLHRLTQIKVTGGDGAAPLDNVVERIFYGEAEADPEMKNLRGQIVKHYDTAGLTVTPAYDFKGQPKATTRKLFRNYKDTVNWTDGNLANDLEDDDFNFSAATDALGRITAQTTPDGSVIMTSYNEAGLLRSKTVAHAAPAITAVYIQDIDYDEKGRRKKIVYGNDVVTRFYYDKETFRLQRLETKRQNGDPLQDWRYTFDPVGNIIHIEDKIAPDVFFHNQKITGVATYTYDALYRLREATGRENAAALTFDGRDNWNDAPFMQRLNPGDPLAMRNYKQSYQYDNAGNILQMKHQAAGNNWTRNYDYQAASNRLIRTQVGENTYSYCHHSRHGYITAMPHLEEMTWNFREELVKTIRQKRIDGGAPEITYYQYDEQGRRIRKITENQADAGNTPTRKEERIYIADYELYRKHSGADAGLERVSLSLTDENHRLAMIETRNEIDDGTEQRLVRYQLHNHLGSACLELDGTADAKVISYEEYYPYGAAAYQAQNAAIKSAAKRYRYTGMERDEESGFEYHGARYYLPWLGRWLSCDPLFKENRAVNQSSKTANRENEKNGYTEMMLHSSIYGNKRDAKENPAGCQPPHQQQGESLRSGKADGQSREAGDQKTPAASREQPLPHQPRLSRWKNLNIYAYGFQNPVIYQDPTGNVPIIQAWWDGYNGASTAGKVGYGFLFILAYLAHVLVNLIVLVLATVLQPLSFWDFSYGALQTSLGLGIGAIFVLLGADVSFRGAMGAKIEMPAYMGNPGGISFGPVVIGGHGFSHWAHEFGHTWQSRLLGPLYLLIVGLPSLISAATAPASHSNFYTEKWADAWAT